MDYEKHIHHVKESAKPFSTIKAVYENGEHIQDAKGYLSNAPDKLLGKLLYYEEQPDNLEELRVILKREKELRKRLRSGNVLSYIKKLSAINRISVERLHEIENYQAS